jgi:hypothetical protein
MKFLRLLAIGLAVSGFLTACASTDDKTVASTEQQTTHCVANTVQVGSMLHSKICSSSSNSEVVDPEGFKQSLDQAPGQRMK